MRRCSPKENSRHEKEVMPTYIVEGGHSLSGRIRPAGNKNAALPAIAATVMASEPVTLQNIPKIGDVETVLEIVAALGAEVHWDDENTVTIDASSVSAGEPVGCYAAPVPQARGAALATRRPPPLPRRPPPPPPFFFLR